MKASLRFVFLALVLIVSTGCGAQSTPVQPAAAPSPVPPTITPVPPTATATATATATTIPSPTPLPGSMVLPIDTLEKSIPWLPLDKTVAPGIAYAGFNTTKPPFNSALIRQAFAYAVDREAIVEKAIKFGANNVAPATTLTPPQTMGRDLYGVVGTSYDPQKAKELLTQAGYTDTSSFPNVLFLVNYSGGGAVPGARFNMASAMAEMWQTNLGIKVEVQTIQSFSDYGNRLATNPPDLFWIGWVADYNDPANFIGELFNPNGDYHDEINYGHFSNSDYLDLIDRAAKSKDPAERQALYIEAERLVCETEAAVIPLYYLTYNLQ